MQRFNFIAKTIVGASLSLGIAAVIPTAQAASLIPQEEGEIQLTNIGCVASKCLDTTTFGYKVTSLPYDFDGTSPQYGLSRLFVDMNGTENNWGSGIKFDAQDEGTNPLKGFWLRPVAYLGASPDSLPTGMPAEQSRAEVGRFLFEFDKVINEVKLDFLDVEEANFSGILKVNGNPFNDFISAQGDGNIQSRTLKNVKSLVLQLGKPAPTARFGQFGDGVRLTVSVPEPGTTVSLGALAVVGLFGLHQRKKFSQLK
ncbi:hypothetical protein NUACC21_10630 [Scytonema sp. NUACC21]